MLLDAQKGLPIEVEVILGEVVRMAKAHNVPLPVGLRGCFCCSASLMFSPQRIETLYALLLIVQNQILRKLEAEK
jgi:2-dehydropantoate 2-reductase